MERGFQEKSLGLFSGASGSERLLGVPLSLTLSPQEFSGERGLAQGGLGSAGPCSCGRSRKIKCIENIECFQWADRTFDLPRSFAASRIDLMNTGI